MGECVHDGVTTSNTVVYLPSNDDGQVTLEVNIKDAAGNFVLVTALFDTGFQVSLIAEAFFRELGYAVPKGIPSLKLNMVDG